MIAGLPCCHAQGLNNNKKGLQAMLMKTITHRRSAKALLLAAGVDVSESVDGKEPNFCCT